MNLSRRGFVTGLIAFPAIVQAKNIMPVKLFNPYLARYKGKVLWELPYYYAPYIPLMRLDLNSPPTQEEQIIFDIINKEQERICMYEISTLSFVKE